MHCVKMMGCLPEFEPWQLNGANDVMSCLGYWMTFGPGGGVEWELKWQFFVKIFSIKCIFFVPTDGTILIGTP
jgi:hypothetical protein